MQPVPAATQRPSLWRHTWPVAQSAARHWLGSVATSVMVQSAARAGVGLLARARRTTVCTPIGPVVLARYAMSGVPLGSRARDA